MLADLEVQNRVAGELESGERLLWSGKPGNRWLYPQDAVLIPFSVMWGGFAIFWEVSVSNSGARDSLVFPLWGIPFVLAGLYLMIGRFFARRWMRRRTLYAVTDQRVISIAPSWLRGEHSTSVWLGSYPPVAKRLARDGRGTLLVGSFPFASRWIAADPSWPGARSATTNAVVFADIENASEVYSSIRHQLTDSRTARTAPHGWAR
jgi:hypothetical protein